MNDNQLSIAGNIVRDPEIRRLADNKAVASFRLASTARRYDATLQDWRNLDSLFITVNCWNRLAERVHECLKGGDPVSVSGRLRMRTYEVDGGKRTVYEIDAQQVAPDLKRVAVELVRLERRAPETVSAGGEHMAGMGQMGQTGQMTEMAGQRSSGPLLPLASESAA